MDKTCDMPQPEGPRDERFNLRLTGFEKSAIEGAATALSITVMDFIRDAALERARSVGLQALARTGRAA